jgi:hypothetical protein
MTLIVWGPYTSATFENNAASHTHLQAFAWAFRDVDVGKPFRFRIEFEWWDQRPGADRKLATKTKTTTACTA